MMTDDKVVFNIKSIDEKAMELYDFLMKDHIKSNLIETHGSDEKCECLASEPTTDTK